MQGGITTLSQAAGLAFADMPRRETAADLAVAYVKKQIWLGNLRPGDRLSPVDVARAFGISETPVREAVAVLAQQGRLIVHKHRGFFVGPFDVTHLVDHYDLLGLVYSWAVQRCTKRVTAEGRVALSSLADLLGECTLPAELYRTVKAIEHLVYTTAGSYSAENAARTLEGVVPDDIYSWVPRSAPLAQESIAAIVKAVCEGDADGAAERAKSFFAAHAVLVIDQLTVDGIFSDQ